MAKKGLGERLVVVEEYRDPKAAKTAKTTKDGARKARENAANLAKVNKGIPVR